MRLIIDAYSVPGHITDLCIGVGESIEIENMILRQRESDLYKLVSDDFETELRKKNDLQVLLQKLKKEDILITEDIPLASQALPLVTAVLDSSGKVFTDKQLNMEKISDELARIKGNFYERVRKLEKRETLEDDQFVTTLRSFLENI